MAFRPRKERREDARAYQTLVKDRERLWKLSAGSSPDRPAIVVTSSLVEPTARNVKCLHCDGEMLLDAHEAISVDGTALRKVSMHCRMCNQPRVAWVKIVSLLPS